MADLFKEILPSITTTKQYLEDIEGYNPFVVNQALSNHIDCILFTNEMNLCSFLPNRMQYDYYFHSIRKGKRPFAFAKKIIDDNLLAIKEYFEYSNTKAKEISRILTIEQLGVVKKTVDKGGSNK